MGLVVEGANGIIVVSFFSFFFFVFCACFPLLGCVFDGKKDPGPLEPFEKKNADSVGWSGDWCEGGMKVEPRCVFKQKRRRKGRE